MTDLYVFSAEGAATIQSARPDGIAARQGSHTYRIPLGHVQVLENFLRQHEPEGIAILRILSSTVMKNNCRYVRYNFMRDAA